MGKTIMKIKSLIASSLILALSACDDSDISPEVGNSIGSVAIISANAFVGTSLTASVSDGNGVEAANISYAWMAGGTAISGETSDSYLLIEADIGTTISVAATYTDNDGYNETTQSDATDAIRFIPVNTDGSVAISGDSYVDRILTAEITDANGSGDTAIAYLWMADGAVIADATDATYTLSAAELGYAITVNVIYTDNDEFEEELTSAATDLVIEEPADSVKTQVAVITDTMGVDIGDGTTDTGELRLKFSESNIDPLVSGKLTVLFKKTGDASNNNPNDNETNIKDAYIGLYGSSTNSGFELVELRIQDGGYEVRNQAGITVANTFTDADWVSVVMTWDASNATATTGPLITLSIDGTDVTAAAFPTLDSGKDGSFASLVDGVQHLIFKMGDNDATVAASYYIDDIKLYSDTAGTSLVFEDDFESYAVADSLDASPYNSSTNEAVVAKVDAAEGAEEVPEVEIVPEIENLQVLEITDTKGTGIGDGTTDTGELRLKLSDESIDPLSTGKLTISFRKSGDATNNNPNDTDTDNKDAYIGLYGSSANSGYDLVELRIQDGGYVIRNQAGITIANTFTDTDWVDIEMTWDATNATASAGPLITMSINGNDVSADAFPTLDSGKTKDGPPLETIMAGVQHLILKIGDNDATLAASFYIDNIKFYSDTAGTELIFEDDFEAATYAVGAELDSNNSRYTSNTNEAVVADRP